MTTDTLESLSEEDFVHDAQTGEVYKVLQIEVEYSQDGIPNGDVKFNDGEHTFTRDAETVYAR